MATAVNEEIKEEIDALIDAKEGRSNDSTEVQGTVEIVATKRKGSKRKRNPETWKTKHVKKPGLRKNSPRIELSHDTECCHKECLKQFSTAHRLREKFETLYYDEQNLYLYALIGRRETKRSVRHPRQPNPTSFPSGKKVGCARVEDSSYAFVCYLYDEEFEC